VEKRKGNGGRDMGKAVIPLHWQIFIGHRPKKYRTSTENIGFIGYVCISIFNLYTSAMPGI